MRTTLPEIAADPALKKGLASLPSSALALASPANARGSFRAGISWLTVLCGLFLGALSLHATNLPAGGGILDAGIVGSYYNNADFSGSPLFTRRDLRVDFDWGTLHKPGGSLSWTKLGQLGADNYSVRWDGRIMARFSENYTIKAFADSVRIWIKPESVADFPTTPLIDSWPASDPVTYAALSASYAFVAGEAYDIRIEYRERTGTAMMRLLWSSPSTPEEVIQPTAFVGEIPPQTGVIMADAVFASTNWGENNPTALRDGMLTLDANGWPLEDFTFVIRPQDVNLNPGTYLITFKGKANVRINLATGAVMQSADGSITYGTITNGDQGYDPATNTTTLRAFVPAGNGNCWPAFANTDRDGPGSAFGLHSGITDLRILKPVTEAGTEPHALDELFDRNALNTLETFVTFRWNDVNGNDDAAGAGLSVGAWADRRQFRPNPRNISFTAQNHEYKVLLSNHTGRDLYIQVPHIATDDYILQMARLIRYGSAANGTPYTSEQANPHFPPLNSNLRVVVEYTNESPWNTAGQYPQGGYVQSMPGVLRTAWLANPSSTDGQRFAAINFDGAMSTDPAVNINGIANGSRYFALRTVEISNIFRSVFGDEAMTAPGKHDPRVRTVMMYQYDNNNGTATNALNFIDRYFFKTDPASTFTGTPRPVSWYLFGGGAATYYASADRYGLDAMNALTAEGEGTFEMPQLAPGEARIAPSGSPWTFTGTAGVYRQSARAAGVIGSIPAPTTTVDSYNYRGMKITVGPQDVAIYEIGRYVHAGNTASQTFAVYEADGTNAARLNTTWSPAGFPTGAVAWRRTGQNIFVISNKAYSWPVILGAGRSYYVVALESSSGSSHSVDVPITPPAGITIDGTASGQLVSGVWTWQVGSTPNRTHGPLNIKVAPAPHVTNTGLNLGFLNDSKDGMETITSFAERLFSPQAAFLAGTGSMEIEVTFPAPGFYGLIYHLAHKRDQTPWDGVADTFENRIMVHLVDGGVTQNITPSSQFDIRPATSGWNHDGYWCKPNTGYDFFGSAPFEVTDASKTYRIRFSGTNASTTRVVLIDNVHIASAAKMTEGQIPSGGGFAEGAPDVSNWEARVMSMYKYPQSFGIKAMSYEGGWYPGGDANKMPLQYASSFYAPSMLQGELNAMSALARAGLAVNTDYTFDFAMPDSGIRNPESFKRIQAWRQMNAGLAPEATNGQPLTSIFTSPSAWLSRNTSGASMSPGGWFSWNVIAAEPGLYDFRLETTGTGTVSVRVNDATVALSGTAGGVRTSASPVFLTKGLHTLRVLTQGGTASLVSLSVTKPSQPAGFSGITASPGNAEAFVRWNAQAGATGYHIYIKSRLDSTFTRFTTTPVTGTQLFVTGLQNNSTYNVVVTYIDSSGVESAYSNQVSVVPSENPPMLAWEFDDTTTKTSGNIPATLQSGAVAGTTSIVTGPGRLLSTNTSVNLDAVGFGSPMGTAFDPNIYIGFSLSPAAGKTLRLTQLDMGLWFNLASGGSGTLQAELRVSTNNFSTHSVVPLSPAPNTLTSGNMAATTGRFVTADLSGIPALQNLPAGTTASFRVYLWGSTSSVNYAGIGKLGATTDDIVLFGFPVDPGATEMPTASPGDGIYASPLSVTLSTPTTGAQIRYTLDGSNPTETTGTLIAGTSGNVVLNASANLRAIAFASGKTPSPVLSRNYTVAATTAAPQFSPPPGVYDTAQQVELSSVTTRASIRYTLDGTDPTPTTGMLYTGPIPVTAATAIKAIAYRSDLVPSSVSSGSYGFDLNSPGTLSLAQSVATVSETAGSFVVTVRRTGGAAGAASVAYATANGAAIAGQDYTAVSGTLNWASGEFADKTVVIPLINDNEVEPNETFTFTLSNASGAPLGSPSVLTITLTSDDTAPPTAAPVFTPVAGTYSGPVTVAIASPTAGASIRYTTNGTDPTATTGTLYSAPFVVSTTTTVKAIAYKTGNANSAVVSAAYTVTAGTIPTGSFLQSGTGDIVMDAENFTAQVANGDSKTWAAATSITGFQGTGYMTTTDTGASSPAWGSGARLDYPVRFSSTGGGTYYIWVRSRSPNSNGNEAWFGVDGTRLGNTNGRFSGGTFYNAFVWRRHATTFTATNNQSRTINLQRYEDGFIVDKILLTRSTSTSYITSNSLNPTESARQLSPVATPVALPTPGVYVGSVQVSLVSGTSGTSIRYTTNGTNPTSTTGTLYTGPFTLSSATTVRAIAYKTGSGDSQVMSFTYTVEAGAVLAFAEAENEVNEADGVAELLVRRLGGTIGAVSVSYATADGSAGAGQDYAATSGTIFWADGDAADKTISIPILNDSIFYENTETFTVTLSFPSAGATLGSPSVATVLIEDDDTNMAPTLTKVAPIGAVSIKTGASLDLHFTAQDDGITGPLQFTWEHVEGPGTAFFGSPTTPQTTVVFDQSGLHTVRISAYDGEFTTTADVTVDVAPANFAPVVATPIPNQIHTAPAAYTYVVPSGTFFDADGDSLAYSAAAADGSALPGWLSFDGATRTFSGTPSLANVGSFALRVQATDPFGAFATTTFTLTVKTAPVIAQGTSASVTMSEDASPAPFGLVLSASDPDGDTLTWSVSTPATRGIASVSGDHLSATVNYVPEANYFGADIFVVRVADGDGNQAFLTVNVTIQAVNDPPVLLTPLVAPAAFALQPYLWSIDEETFSDIEDEVLTYTATLSNGSALPPWLSFDSATRTFSGTPAAENAGSLTLRITATDSGGLTAIASTVLLINSPATTLYWGGGTTDLADGTSVDSRTGDAALMAGRWDTTLLNWNSSLTATTGHRAWTDGNFAHFRFVQPGNSLTPDVELAQNLLLGGLTFEFTQSAPTNSGFEFLSNDATTRTLTVSPGAVLRVRTAATSHVVGIRRAGHVSGRGGVTLAGNGGFVFEGYNGAGVPFTNAGLDIESGTISGPVEVRSGRLRIGSISSGATGLPNVTAFAVLGETLLQPAYQNAADNRIGDNTPVRLAGGGFQLRTSSTSLQIQETIGSLTIDGSALLVPFVDQASNSQLATLTLANGLSRGTNGRGTLVVTNTATTGGLGVTGAGVRLAGHGLPSSTWLPWAFHFGRGQLLDGGQSTVSAPGFLVTDASGELLVQPFTAAAANLADTSWQAYDATSHVAIDNLALTGTLAEDVTVRSLGISLPGSSTFGLGGKTLRTAALGFGDNSGRSLTFGTADANRGVLTVPEGLSELYIHHRRSNTSAASVLTLNAVIAGAQDVIYSGTTGQIALAAANTYTGKTYINAHTVRLDGSVAPLAQSAEVYLAPSARLHVNGSNQVFGDGAVRQVLSGGGASPLGVNLFSSNRNVTLGANATLAPGTTGANAAFRVDLGTGKLILATGSKLALDLGAPSASDQVDFATAADWLAGSGQPTLELTLGTGFDYNEVYTIIRNVTAPGLTFAAITGHNSATHTPVVSFQNNAYVLSFTPTNSGPGDDPASYDAWLANYPELDALPDALLLPGADPDGDGLPNLIEYALGGSPTNPADTNILPRADTSENGLNLNFTPQVIEGLTYIIEASPDLFDWSDASDVTAWLIAGQPFTYTDNTPITARRFLRLRIVVDAP